MNRIFHFMRHITAITLVGICIIMAGCDSVGFKGGQNLNEAESSRRWPFVPVTMRVHPFSTITASPDGSSLILEVRMELLDQLGDTTKGVGDFRFELYRAASVASHEGEDIQLAQWPAAIRTLEENRSHYDPITRTYLFKLNLNEMVKPHENVRLVVQYTNQLGIRLQTESTLTYTPSPASN